MKLPLCYYGNPFLRKKCQEIDGITDEIRQLVQDMVDTMEDLNGIGLAAPQVGKSIRLFITKVPVPSKEDPDDWEEGPLYVFINPILSEPGKETWESSEGCLSIPKVYVPVVRPYCIKVEATDLEGNRFTKEFSGLQARCCMHENDHINGVLMIDRTDRKTRKTIDPDLRKIKKEHPLK